MSAAFIALFISIQNIPFYPWRLANRLISLISIRRDYLVITNLWLTLFPVV